MKIVQRHRGWVSDESLRDIAEFLQMSDRRTGQRRDFLQPDLSQARWPARDFVLRQRELLDHGLRPPLRDDLSKRLGIQPGETTPDGRFTLLPIVCLGACDHAPVMMVDDDLHRDLTSQNVDAILEKYA